MLLLPFGTQYPSRCGVERQSQCWGENTAVSVEGQEEEEEAGDYYHDDDDDNNGNDQSVKNEMMKKTTFWLVDDDDDDVVDDVCLSTDDYDGDGRTNRLTD